MTGPWVKSSFCNGADACAEVAYRRSCSAGEACVEVGLCPHSGEVLVRDSKLGEASPVLRFPVADWVILLKQLAGTPKGIYGRISVWGGSSAGYHVRDREDRDGPELVFTRAEWAAFVLGVRDGQFDPKALAAGDGPTVDGHSRGSVGPYAAQESSPVSQ